MGTSKQFVLLASVLWMTVVRGKSDLNDHPDGVITKEMWNDELFLINLRKAFYNDMNRVICQPPYTAIEDRCLLFFNFSSGSWMESKYDCQVIQGDLVKLNDANLMGHVVKYIMDNDLKNIDYWIGASDIDTPGLWVWTDGSVMQMGTPYWGSDVDLVQKPVNADEHCAVLTNHDNYFIYERDCADRETGAICEFTH